MVSLCALETIRGPLLIFFFVFVKIIIVKTVGAWLRGRTLVNPNIERWRASLICVVVIEVPASRYPFYCSVAKWRWL